MDDGVATTQITAAGHGGLVFLAEEEASAIVAVNHADSKTAHELGPSTSIENYAHSVLLFSGGGQIFRTSEGQSSSFHQNLIRSDL